MCIVHSNHCNVIVGVFVCSVYIGFWDGNYVNQLPYVWHYVVVKNSFKHARWNPRGPMCFRCPGCLICQDPVSCYCHFVLWPLGLRFG